MKNDNGLIEERWNTYSHASGILLGSIGLFILLKDVSKSELTLPIIVYSLSIILLFSASTAYHAVTNPKIKRQLRVLDHISIYYLIAGTYTPVCLWILADSKGILLLWLVWGIAFFGTVLKLFFTGKFEVFSLLLYGVMGWLIVIDVSYLVQHMSSDSVFYLALGGGFYTVGMGVYAIKKIRFNHFIWHLFVLGGALSHWLMIYNLSSK
ncbi:MAG: hemolysin III family protein [Croceivirga sp.]